MEFTLEQLAGNKLLLRFLQDVVPDASGCWLWRLPSRQGYGRMNLPDRGGSTVAHRVSYELFVGAIPVGYDIDHLCRVRACVNPAHLEAVTRRENLLRGKGVAAANAAKTHCPQGHPYTGENLAVYTSGGRTCRRCRACDTERNRVAREERWAAAKGDPALSALTTR